MKTKILITSLLAALVILGVSFAQTTSSDINQTTSSVAPAINDSSNIVSDDSLSSAEPAIDAAFDIQSSTTWPEGQSDYPASPQGFGTMIAVMGGIWLLFIGLGIAGFVFWIVMLIDVIQHQEKDKALWVIVIVLGNTIGAIVYYFAARKPRLVAMQATQGPVVAPTPPTQIPPVSPTPIQ